MPSLCHLIHLALLCRRQAKIHLEELQECTGSIGSPPDSALLTLFCLQEQAESRLEALHDAVEKQPEAFLESSRSLGEWPKFRESLIGLTDVVRSYFEKLVLVSRACFCCVTRPVGNTQPEDADTAEAKTAVLAHQPFTMRAWRCCGADKAVSAHAAERVQSLRMGSNHALSPAAPHCACLIVTGRFQRAR